MDRRTIVKVIALVVVILTAVFGGKVYTTVREVNEKVLDVAENVETITAEVDSTVGAWIAFHELLNVALEDGILTEDEIDSIVSAGANIFERLEALYTLIMEKIGDNSGSPKIMVVRNDKRLRVALKLAEKYIR